MAKTTAEEIAIVDAARAKTLKTLSKKGVTPCRVALRLAEALSAEETKATYDQKDGVWVYSKKLIAHGVRLKAVELASVLLDMRPSEKHEIDLKQPINVIIRKFSDGNNAPK